MPDEHKVLKGLNDWLFLQNDTNRIIEQTSGTYPLPKDFFYQWRNLFIYRQNRLKELGVQYLYAVAPNKECVYRRYLPSEVSFSEKRPVEVVSSAAANLVDFLYPLDALTDLSLVEDVYSRGDTHWNGRGGYLFYRHTMARLGIEGVDPSEVTFSSEMTMSDLSSKLGKSEEVERVVLKKKTSEIVENNGITNVGSRIVFENVDDSLPSAVIFRDSFCSRIIHLYASSFSRTVLIWQPNVDYSVVQAESPDIVLSQQAERFLVSCPDDVGGRSHEEWVEWKKSKLR